MIADSAHVTRLTPSPNYNARRGRAIDCIVLHYTGMSSGEAASARLRDPASEVSAHYLVWEDGSLDQLVAEADRAWHAGRSFWRGETDVNAVSVGVEIVNAGHDGGCPPYPEAQIAAVVALCRDVAGRLRIAPHRVLAHSDVAPDRKEDPGEHFPWDRLAAAGVAASLPPGDGAGTGDAARAHADLAAIGYGPSSDAAGFAARLRAFQRRWRPDRVDGRLDDETSRLLDRAARVGFLQR